VENHHVTDINVLVVDDLRQNLIAVEALIARPGIRVLQAVSGEEALEMLLANDVALALVDVQMPGMDGFELAELIRGSQRTRTVPLIFLTAAARESENFFRGYDAGAVDFLYKPIDPQVLRSKVNVFVELYSQKKQLAAQLDELKQSLKLNELFTAVLGHDLRNPLASVANGAAVLLKTSTDPAVTSVASRIRLSTQRMANMVEQLLDVARFRAHGLELDLRSTDYRLLCETIASELQKDDRDPRVKIEVRGNMQGTVDVDRFSQVISNLVGNALQHGAPDAPVRLLVDGTDADRIVLHVANEGVIAQEHLPHIFDSFRAGAGDQSKHRGLGLGLYIVKTFVAAHGGEVMARSSPSDGTVIQLSMPRAMPRGYS
jgi:two-component system sensor histidine kinase/response regulator